MQKGTLRIKESYEKIRKIIEDLLGKHVLGIVLFGSTIYMGKGHDIDIIIVVERDLNEKEKLDLEAEISRRLFRSMSGTVFDVHIMSLRDFENNLVPGSFLSGLALGYEILLDKVGIEDRIIKFLEDLSNTRYVLHNEYGEWNLSHHARVTLSIKRRNASRSS